VIYVSVRSPVIGLAVFSWYKATVYLSLYIYIYIYYTNVLISLIEFSRLPTSVFGRPLHAEWHWKACNVALTVWLVHFQLTVVGFITTGVNKK
jgi:hypothetical protein